MRKIRAFFAKVGAKLSWPAWYFYGNIPVLLLIGLEFVETWLAFAYLILGVTVYWFKKLK